MPHKRIIRVPLNIPQSGCLTSRISSSVWSTACECGHFLWSLSLSLFLRQDIRKGPQAAHCSLPSFPLPCTQLGAVTPIYSTTLKCSWPGYRHRLCFQDIEMGKDPAPFIICCGHWTGHCNSQGLTGLLTYSQVIILACASWDIIRCIYP